MAVSYFGRARTTVDVDVVVAVAGESWRGRLVEALRKAGLSVDEKRIDDALKSDYRIARFSDGKSPLAVDVILSLEEKLRKMSGAALGLATFFQVPEDLVLAKLRMIRATVPRERALKDVEDVRAVLRFSKVDVDSVKERAKKEGTLRTFEEIMTEDA